MLRGVRAKGCAFAGGSPFGFRLGVITCLRAFRGRLMRLGESECSGFLLGDLIYRNRENISCTIDPHYGNVNKILNKNPVNLKP